MRIGLLLVNWAWIGLDYNLGLFGESGIYGGFSDVIKYLFVIMDQKTIVFLVATVMAAAFLFSGAPQTHHNLISAEKAEAFTLFEQWQIKHGKNYREHQVQSISLRKPLTGSASSSRTSSS